MKSIEAKNNLYATGIILLQEKSTKSKISENIQKEFVILKAMNIMRSVQLF